MGLDMNPEQLVEELIAAGLPAIGADSAGNVQYSRVLTEAEQTTAAQVIAAHNPETGTARRRAIAAAIQLAQTVNGVDVTALAAAQVRNLTILLAAANGWIVRNAGNTAWVINITAESVKQAVERDR